MAQQRIHCPDPDKATPEQLRMGLTGCGSFNIEAAENEPGVYDCHNCGMWFTLNEEEDQCPTP